MGSSYDGVPSEAPERDDDDAFEDEVEGEPQRPHNVTRLCCAFLASMTTGGTTYAFSLYGDALKHHLHLTQSQLDTISTANFCSGLLSWIPGLIVDRFGTRVGMSLGGTLGAASLMVYWAVAKGMILSEFEAVTSDPRSKTSPLIVAVLSALGVTIFASCALITGAVFKLIVANCGPGTKGSAVGAAKGYVGLGAGAYACLFEAIRSPTSSDLDFLPLAAGLFILAAVIPSCLVLPSKENEMVSVSDSNSPGPALTPSGVRDVVSPFHFKVLYSSLIAFASIIIGNSLYTLYEDSTQDEESAKSSEDEEHHPNYLLGATLIAIWVGPIATLLFLPHRNERGGDSEEEAHGLLTSNEEGGDGEAADESHDSLATDENHEVEVDDSDQEASVVNPDNANPNYTLFQMLQTPSAWYMLWITTIIVGAGTVETNNLGQMVESLNFHKSTTPACLALFSVAQAAGRVMTGSISEAAMTSTGCCGTSKSIFRTDTGGMPRPTFLIFASLASVLAHTILAFAVEEISFVGGIIASGFAFGSAWPLLVLITSEVFGTKHAAANYMFFDGFTSAAGTVLLSKIVAQEVYESHIDGVSAVLSDGVEGGDELSLLSQATAATTCYGSGCFQLTHIVAALLSATCVGVGVMMVYSTKHIYNKGRQHQQ